MTDAADSPIPPDRRRLLADLEAGDFLVGVAEGHWDDVPDSGLTWPMAVFWVAAEPRPGAPEKYYVRLDCTSYPADAPTGTFWDLATGADLANEKRPFGSGQVAVTFRTDWENGRAFYHPFDRVAAKSHADWVQKYPDRLWNEQRSIVDLLSVIYGHLHSREYDGVRGTHR